MKKRQKKNNGITILSLVITIIIILILSGISIGALTGEHGVMIPEQNVKNLHLCDEVIEAVKNKQFHIYSISTIEEGIEILTGVPAGKKDKDGNFPAGTVNYLVEEKLRNYANISNGKNS